MRDDWATPTFRISRSPAGTGSSTPIGTRKVPVRPFVLLQHFRGNLDNWDPPLIDALSNGRRVVTFDNVGIGATTGVTPSTIAEMARGALTFIDALGLDRVDLLGFSIGSFVAQEIALSRPSLVKRVVLASAAPQGAAGMHGWSDEVISAVGQPDPSPDGYLNVFFTQSEASRAAGVATLGRIFGPKDESGHSDDLGDPAGAVRRGVFVGRSQPQPPATPNCDPSTGLHRGRRQRSDDPPPLLLPIGGVDPELGR